jgi:flavorubredoxin
MRAVKTALIIYFSSTGNTEKAAQAIKMGLEKAGVGVTVRRSQDAADLDYFNYDLVCVGSPSIEWHPANPICDLLKKNLAAHRKEGKIKLGAPKIAGRNALIFITYSGPHTGLGEAVPAGKYIGQFFEHIGFNIVGEWYILSQFNVSHPAMENANTKGRMGDIRGKPNAEDLQRIKQDAETLANKI